MFLVCSVNCRRSYKNGSYKEKECAWRSRALAFHIKELFSTQVLVSSKTEWDKKIKESRRGSDFSYVSSFRVVLEKSCSAYFGKAGHLVIFALSIYKDFYCSKQERISCSKP